MGLRMAIDSKLASVLTTELLTPTPELLKSLEICQRRRLKPPQERPGKQLRAAQKQ